MILKTTFNRCLCALLLVTALATSCQKDAGEDAIDKKQAQLKADSVLSTTANQLAASGTLSFKTQDTTYTFTAPEDSIAFVNMSIKGESYFGITAINKAHTLSFGISAGGSAVSKTKNNIAGGQLLLKPDALHTSQYTLTNFTNPGDAGRIKLSQYQQKNTLAKGTFFTFMSKGDSTNTTLLRVDGSFNLKLK